MQAGRYTISFLKKLGRPVARNQPAMVLVCCLLSLVFFLSQRAPSPPPAGATPPLPSVLVDQLRQFQEKDDLSGWIYGQIQWVVKAPATRALLLARAAGAAWRTPRSNEEIQAWQDLLINEGYVLLMSGDIVHSTDAYTAAFQWAKTHPELTDDALILENILKPLGNNYTRLGDYEQALFIHRKALAVAASMKDRDALAGVYSNLANMKSNSGQPGQSLEYCKKGLEIADKHSALRGLLLSEQADAFEQLQQTGAARESIQKSIVVLEQAIAIPGKGKEGRRDASYWLLMAYQQAGDIFSPQPAISLKFYNKAIALQTRLSKQYGAIRKREKAKLFQRLAGLCFRTGQPAQAVSWLDQCLSALIPGKTMDSLREADLYAENTLLDMLFTRAGLYMVQNHTDRALQFYRLCFAVERKLRNELITGSSKERSVSDSRMRYETAIHTAWTAWEKTGEDKYRLSILEFMESSKSQLLLEELLQQQQSQPSGDSGDSLESRIRFLERALIYYRKEALQSGDNDSLMGAKAAQEKQTEWDLAELRKKAWHGGVEAGMVEVSSLQAAPFSMDSLQSLLRKEEAVRSFFAGSHALYTIEFGREGIRFAERLELPGQWQDSIRDFLHAYFEKGANNMINSPDAYYRRAFAIYRQLFGGHPLQAGEKYILLPDGVLSLLPVDALVTDPACPLSPENWPYVIRQAQVSYAWSMQTLREQVREPGNNSGFSGFFLSGNTRHQPLLQAIAREKDGMARIIKKGEWFTDEGATTAAFREALQHAAVVHISSHAYTGKDTLDAPHIELYNEPFYLFELKGMEKHPALVVLSACRTGDGRMVTGEGVQSLARAFTASGANAVIAGWWNVNDAVAAQLMQGFYRSLAAGANAAEAGSGAIHRVSGAAGALRQSKLDWLRDPAVTYLHKLPYFWAALNYQGNPAPLRDGFQLDQKEDTGVPGSRYWWLLAGIVVLAGLPFLLVRRR